ncbi:hypothetical protein L7F22_069299 [Adiantum nelumboides]|nr:hypothetical protein [Adiantum nelumboides]
MSQATQQVLPTIDEETPFHKGDAMSTQEVVEHESDFVAQKPSNDMNKGSENMLPTIEETQIHEGNTRNSEEKMVVVENQSDVQTSPKPSDDMIIKDTYNMPLGDEEVEGSEKKDEANEEHQGALATVEVQDKVDKGTGKATRNANKAQSIQGRVQGTEGGGNMQSGGGQQDKSLKWMSGEDEGRQPPQHPYWTRLRQSFGQGGESSSAIEEEEEANQPTPESQYSSSSSDTEDFEQVPEEVPNLELHRGRIPERMQQRGNAPGVDAVIPGGNQVRQSNYRNWNNQGPNQRLQAQAAGWNNQRNQDRDGENHPCTYCGISGHRQGPECPLWCKHRSERGMPIVQYNNRGNQPQQRPPAQLNDVILEEVEPEQPEDYLKTIQQESDDILRADKDCCSKGKTNDPKVEKLKQKLGRKKLLPVRPDLEEE